MIQALESSIGSSSRAMSSNSDDRERPVCHPGQEPELRDETAPETNRIAIRGLYHAWTNAAQSDDRDSLTAQFEQEPGDDRCPLFSDQRERHPMGKIVVPAVRASILSRAQAIQFLALTARAHYPGPETLMSGRVRGLK